jgi:tripeptidyl-peptidase-2
LSKEVGNSPASAATATEGAEPDEQSKDDGIHPDLFDENFKELKKWVDVKCTKYGILLVTHERRSQRLGTALKVFSFAKSCYITEYFVPFLPLFFYLVSESMFLF